MSANKGWSVPQKEFLEKFYKGVNDPDTKISMLIEATGGGIVSFHATSINPEGTLKGHSNAEILVATKIACLEHELLIFNGLLKPELY